MAAIPSRAWPLSPLLRSRAQQGVGHVAIAASYYCILHQNPVWHVDGKRWQVFSVSMVRQRGLEKRHGCKTGGQCGLHCRFGVSGDRCPQSRSI